VISIDSIDSTNRKTKELLVQGESEGLIVTARTQTAGRGRKDRSWYSPIGGLYFSIALKPRIGPEQAPLLGLLSACAVARGIRSLGVENVRLKWPNDVLVQQYKIAGILSESILVDDNHLRIVVGIGVNQNCPVSEMSEHLRWPTTSIIDELGKETSIEALLCSIVNEMDELLQAVENDSSYAVVLEEWRRVSSTLGTRVRIYEDEKTTDGIAKDIGEDGSLIVETDEGLMKVVSGDVAHLGGME